SVDDLVSLPVFGGRHQRRSAAMWLSALEAARRNQDPPQVTDAPNGPPPPARWSRRKPDAAARLEVARAALSELSQLVGVPTENLISPDLVRRLCWEWDALGIGTTDPVAITEEYLATGQARPWQRELVVPVLAAAMVRAPRTDAESDD
ncbi:MAG: ribonuclease, partial [Mycobacterium sp.]|nr:ribonuclease [Mycobacterium sp.]